MISLSGLGGLDAASIQKLFAAAAPASSAQTGPASGAAASAGGGGDPFAQIKAILSAAQMRAAPGAAPASSSGTRLVEAAYAEQTAEAGFAAQLRTQAEPAQTVQSMQASMQTSQAQASAADGTVTGESSGVASVTDFGWTSATTGTQNLDTFQMSVQLGGAAVAIGFTVSGLGPLQLVNNEIMAGQGPLQDYFQIGVSNDGGYVSLDFNVGGLANRDQAQQLAEAFQKALGSPSALQVNGDAYSYDQSLGGGASLDIQGIVGY
jgi:hypothetical protein